MLWCDGRQQKRAHQSSPGSDEDVPAGDVSKSKRSKKTKSFASEEKQERVETLKTKLRGKHGTAHTPIQYTLWAEMIDVGTHSSIDEPPSVPMFQGKARHSKAKAGDNEMATVFTEMAKSVINILAPTTKTSSSTSTGTMSPGKVAELRSKYLQQMRELHQLFEAGALTEKEFFDQKSPILDQLTHLNPGKV